MKQKEIAFLPSSSTHRKFLSGMPSLLFYNKKVKKNIFKRFWLLHEEGS